MKQYAVGFLLLMLLLLSGCSQLGLTSPKSVPDRLAYGQVTVQQVASVTATLVKERKVSVDKAKKIRDLLITAQKLLDESAVLYYSGDRNSALKQLELGFKALEEAETALKGEKA